MVASISRVSLVTVVPTYVNTANLLRN